jgi:2-oxo-4-hydroxy-4-carboxy--5-ureidoimidazoline (OHCU) decarboxylase
MMPAWPFPASSGVESVTAAAGVAKVATRAASGSRRVVIMNKFPELAAAEPNNLTARGSS